VFIFWKQEPKGEHILYSWRVNRVHPHVDRWLSRTSPGSMSPVETERGSQLDAVLDDVLLLLDDLVLLGVAGLRRRHAGGDGGVQRADAVSAPGRRLGELQLGAVGRMLLACGSHASGVRLLPSRVHGCRVSYGSHSPRLA